MTSQSPSVLVVFIIVLVIASNSEEMKPKYKIMLVNGSPTTKGEIFYDETLDNCIRKCYEDSNCVFSHYKASVCQIYLLSNDPTARTLVMNKSELSSILAIKINHEEVCRDTASSNFPFTVTLPAGRYTMASIPDTTTISINYTCLSNWVNTVRYERNYCMGIIEEANSARDNAIQKCGEMNATLAFFASFEEADAVTAALFVNPSASLNLWVDGTRTIDCQKQNPECNDFEWGDKTNATNMIMTRNMDGQPTPWMQEECLTLMKWDGIVGFNDEKMYYQLPEFSVCN